MFPPFHRPGAVGTTSTKGFENGEANAQTDAAEDTMHEGKEQKPAEIRSFSWEPSQPA